MSDAKKWWLGFLVGAVLSALIGIFTAFQGYRSSEIQQRQLELQANEKLGALVKEMAALEKKIVAHPQDHDLNQVMQQLGDMMATLAEEQRKYIASGKAREITDLIKQVADMQKKAAQFHNDGKAKDQQIADLRTQLAVARSASSGPAFSGLGLRTTLDNIGTTLNTGAPSPIPQDPPPQPFGGLTQQWQNQYLFPQVQSKSTLEETWDWIKQVPGGLIFYAVIIVGGIVGAASKK